MPWFPAVVLTKGRSLLDVRLLVDRSIVEVFVAGGQVAGLMATRTPNATLATAVHLFAAGGGPALTLNRLDIWELGCGWNMTRG